jgi:hypothetical protein
LPFVPSLGVLDVELLLGVLDDEADDGVLDESDDELDDGVLDDVPAPADDVLGVADELDDIEPLGVDGGVVDDDDDVDGDGVTTGGVVLDVDDVSRLQPAIPRTSPVQSNVTSALFIAISRLVEKWGATRRI